MKNSIMLDLETLGTTADSVILSIGAVKFDLESGDIDPDMFYRSVSVDSNLENGRHLSEATLIWWLKQTKEAQGVFHEPKIELIDALENLSDWIGNNAKFHVWSNGADFDIPMLNHAYGRNNMTTPWEFWNARCYRTFKNLPGAPKATKPNTLAHNALADALYQAQHLIEIQQFISPRKTIKKAKAA